MSSDSKKPSKQNNQKVGDFSRGPVWKNIMAQAVPLTVAQLVHLLYNVVDRIYIGHMPGDGSMALTGIGLTFPVVTLIMAFAALFGIAAYTVLLCYTLFKTGSLSKQIFNAH